jgi:hypothetical protein
MINMGTASFCFNSYPDRGRGSMLVGLLGRVFYLKTAPPFSSFILDGTAVMGGSNETHMRTPASQASLMKTADAV